MINLQTEGKRVKVQLGGLMVMMVLVFGAGELSAQQIEEVTVTAQKREQNIQDVPISITTLSGDEIKGLGFNNAADIQYQTPGLIVSYSSTNAIPNFVLRGVGLNDFTAIQSSPVAIHVDEVYYGNSTLLNFGLFDLERVEVLKGPQGTLFGRNSTGGAVNFFSAKPTDEFAANLDVGGANYDNFTAEGYVNVPLSETMFSRFSMMVVDQSGGAFDHPVHGEIGDQEKFALRGQLLWDVSDKLTAHLTVFGGEDDSDGNQYQGIPTYNTGVVRRDAAGDPILDVDGDPVPAIRRDAAGDPILDADGDPVPITFPCNPSSAGNPNCSFDGGDEVNAQRIDDNNPFSLQSDVINRDEIEAFGSVLRIDYEVREGLTLTSVTGYNDVERESQEDADGSPARNVDVGYETDFDQFSEELRLASAGDRWDWTLGLYYSSDELDAPLTETDGSALAYRQNHAYTLETDSFAVFLHNEFRLTDPLAVFGGLRYTHEERDFKGGTIDASDRGITDLPGTPGPSSRGDFVPAVPGPAGPDDAPPTGAGAYLDREIDFDEVSWTIGASFDVSDQAMVYAKIANGFKSGGFIGDITVQGILDEPYDEETLTAFEIGLKSDWLNGRLRWNTSFFYYDYEDAIFALSTRNPDAGAPGVPPGLLINANGGDADLYGLESELWLVPTEGLDIKFGFTVMDTETSDTIREVGTIPVEGINDDDELVYAPKFSANGLVRYEVPVAGGWLGFGQFDFTTRTKHWAESTNVPVSEIEGYTLLNARIGIGSQNRKWGVSLWCKNLTDEQYTQYINDLSSLGAILKTPGYPRTYGLDLSWNF